MEVNEHGEDEKRHLDAFADQDDLVEVNPLVGRVEKSVGTHDEPYRKKGPKSDDEPLPTDSISMIMKNAMTYLTHSTTNDLE